MRLNTKCSIAFHCLVFIAEYGDQLKVTSELLAKSTGCNAAAIRSILSALHKAGFISVARGVGGTRLVRDPKHITAWEVYYTVEPDGLKHFIGFHPNPNEMCPVGQKIAPTLKKSYGQINKAVQEAMEKITLQQLLDDYHSDDALQFDYES